MRYFSSLAPEDGVPNSGAREEESNPGGGSWPACTVERFLGLTNPMLLQVIRAPEESRNCAGPDWVLACSGMIETRSAAEIWIMSSIDEVARHT